MGMHFIQKEDLSACQFRHVAQHWYEQWEDSIPLRASSIEFETFKLSFLDRFFPRELREAKFKEFINLKQGEFSVKEYALKFTLLSKYAPKLGNKP